MASIEARTTRKGIRYRARITLNGHPRLSETFTTRRAAERWAQKIETAIREGRYAPTKQKDSHSFGELLDRFIADELGPHTTRTNPDSQILLLRWWERQIGGHSPLHLVSASEIAAARNTLKSGGAISGKPVAASTINGYLTILSAAFTYGITELYWLEENPCRKVSRMKQPRGRVRFLSDREREALLDACRNIRNKQLFPLTLLAIATGARQGELMSLRWNKVDLERGMITFDKTKNGERRSVPVVGRALSELKQMAKAASDDHVFVGRNGGVCFPQGQWEKVKDIAGLEDFTFHDLRHTAAAYLAMSGASLLEIAEILGHRTLDMVRRYAHLTEAHTRDVVRRMNAKYLPEAAKASSVVRYRKRTSRWILRPTMNRAA